MTVKLLMNKEQDSQKLSALCLRNWRTPAHDVSGAQKAAHASNGAPLFRKPGEQPKPVSSLLYHNIKASLGIKGVCTCLDSISQKYSGLRCGPNCQFAFSPYQMVSGMLINQLLGNPKFSSKQKVKQAKVSALSNTYERLYASSENHPRLSETNTHEAAQTPFSLSSSNEQAELEPTNSITAPQFLINKIGENSLRPYPFPTAFPSSVNPSMLLHPSTSTGNDGFYLAYGSSSNPSANNDYYVYLGGKHELVSRNRELNAAYTTYSQRVRSRILNEVGLRQPVWNPERQLSQESQLQVRDLVEPAEQRTIRVLEVSDQQHYYADDENDDEESEDNQSYKGECDEIEDFMSAQEEDDDDFMSTVSQERDFQKKTGIFKSATKAEQLSAAFARVFGSAEADAKNRFKTTFNEEQAEDYAYDNVSASDDESVFEIYNILSVPNGRATVVPCQMAFDS